MGYLANDRMIDLKKLGGTLVVGAAVILAIRNARREPEFNPHFANRDWEAEIDFALTLTCALLERATTQHAELFHQVAVKVTDGIVPEDIME
jgi:hypothetical protein